MNDWEIGLPMENDDHEEMTAIWDETASMWHHNTRQHKRADTDRRINFHVSKVKVKLISRMIYSISYQVIWIVYGLVNLSAAACCCCNCCLDLDLV